MFVLERIISREVIPNHNLTQPSYALRFRTQGGAVAVTSSSARFFVLGEEELFTGAALILPRPKAAIAIFPAIPSNPDELKDN